jgi:hypothetical protein
VKRLALLPALLVWTACAAPEGTRSRTLTTDHLEDIPAPAEARYRDRGGESFSYRAASFRCGKFVYDYDGSVEEAATFYKEVMTAPPYFWVLVADETVVMNSRHLTFKKNHDHCTVSIDRVQEGGPKDGPVSIVVLLNPTKKN